jgi:hypothetical protein
MSQTTTTPPTTTPVVTPPVSKNAYFTYTGGHRDPQQVWNVDGITIHVQGDTPAACHSTAKVTYFAKKHLLTFKGGKQTDVLDKAENILDHRIDGDRKWKYGNTTLSPDDGANTAVVCDDLTVTQLKSAFATALKGMTGKKKIATVTFPSACVLTYNADNTTSRSSTMQVQFWRSDDRATFVLIHYHTAH